MRSLERQDTSALLSTFSSMETTKFLTIILQNTDDRTDNLLTG